MKGLRPFILVLMFIGLRCSEQGASANQVFVPGDSAGYVSIPNHPQLQNPTEFTIEFWLNPSRRDGRPISKGDGLNDFTDQSYHFDLRELDYFRAEIFWEFDPTKAGYDVLRAPIPLGQWTHAAVVFSSRQGSLSLFLNGELVAQNTGLEGRLLRQSTKPLIFGWTPPFFDTFSNARLDEVRIWDVAREPANIVRDMSCTLTGAEPHLVAYWNFEGVAVTDLTGNGHDGILYQNAQLAPMPEDDSIHAGGCGGSLPITPRFVIVDETPGGGQISVTPPRSSFAINTVATLTALPDVGWTFLDWKGNAESTATTITLRMTGEKRVRARFGTVIKPQKNGNGTVTLDPPSPPYPYGTTVRVTATPDAGNYFTGWSGIVGGTRNPLTYVVKDGTPLIRGSFAALPPDQNTLTVTHQGLGRTTVTPQASYYAPGEPVTVTATADSGQAFLGWAGDAAGTDNPLSVTMDKSRSLRALFTERPRLAIQSIGREGVLVTLVGATKATYAIETSTDLATWTPHTTLQTSYGEAQVIELPVGDQPLFYRVISQ